MNIIQKGSHPNIKGQVFTCQRSGECRIDKITRRKCAACRFAKCKSVGMKHSTERQRQCDVSQGQLQKWTEYSHTLFENLKSVEISKKSFERL